MLHCLWYGVACREGWMDDQRMRSVSSSAYGNAYLLEVANAIGLHPKARFIQKDIVESSHIDKSLVGAALKKLVAAGLVEDLGMDGREHPYQKRDSEYWGGAQRFLDELRGL
jgi:hypothetical protein